MRIKSILTLIIMVLWASNLCAQQTEIKYLSGTDADNTVEWDFYCTDGMNSGKWSKIAVPSNWELQGYGKQLWSRGTTSGR